MFSASQWVLQIIAKTQEQPLSTDAVLKSLEKNVGQGEKALSRVQEVLDYIDGQLIERKGGLVMRDLWTTVADYLEKVQEGLAAA